MRRQVRRSRPTNSIPTSAYVASLFAAGDARFEASSYTIDEVTGKTSAFVDLNDGTHTLAQSTDALQVVVPTAATSLNGQLAASFAGGQRYVSSRAASAWKFLHDGTGCDVWGVFTNSVNGREWAATVTGLSTTEVGVQFYVAPTTVDYYASNGTGYIISRTVSRVANGTGLYVRSSYDAAATPQVVQQSGGNSSTGSTSGSPSAADPLGTLTLGAGTAGNLPATMSWAAMYVFKRRLASQEASRLVSYIYSRWGASV